jgi:hypothetical protein
MCLENLRKSILILLLISGVFSVTFGQQQYFTQQQLMAEYEMKVLKARKALSDSMTRMEFFIIASPVMTCLQDGHTSLQFPRDDISLIEDKLFPFPVQVNWRDSTVRISEDRSEPKTGIPVGAKILEINHVPVKQILDKMYVVVSGEKVFFKNSNIELNFTRYLYLFYHDSVFLIKYKFDNQYFNKMVNGIPVGQRYPNSGSNQTSPAQQTHNISLELKIIPDSSIAIITLFYFPQGNWHPKLDSVFRVLRKQKIKDLIIDIRNNGGGNSASGDDFLQYISKVPFKQFGATTIRTSRKQIEFYKWYNLIVDSTAIGIKHWPESPPDPLKRTKNKFENGHVYLLINNNTYSSAASFSWAFKYFKMGTVIGEETGGMAVCFGNNVLQQLTNTKLQYSVSHKKFYHYGATDADGMHGTIPDYAIPSEQALDFAITYIMKSRNQQSSILMTR